MEVRWLFKREEEDDSKHMFCSLLAAVWGFAPPVCDCFLICFHTSLAVPKSRNKRAEEQKRCEDQEQHSPPTGLPFFCFIFLLIFLCWAGLHVMRGFIDLAPCSYLVTIAFGFLLLQKVSHRLISAITWNPSVSRLELLLPILHLLVKREISGPDTLLLSELLACYATGPQRR